MASLDRVKDSSLWYRGADCRHRRCLLCKSLTSIGCLHDDCRCHKVDGLTWFVLSMEDNAYSNDSCLLFVSFTQRRYTIHTAHHDNKVAYFVHDVHLGDSRMGLMPSCSFRLFVGSLLRLLFGAISGTLFATAGSVSKTSGSCFVSSQEISGSSSATISSCRPNSPSASKSSSLM